MKKTLLLFIAVIVFQFCQSQNIRYGIKGGINYASFITNFDSALDYKYKLGYQVGGFVKIKLDENIFVQPELLYSMQGAKYDLNLVSIQLPQNDIDQLFREGNSEYRISESTIILPILLKYYFSNNFNVEIGPQLDYLFHIKNNANIFSDDQGLTVQGGSSSVSEFNFGVNLGVAYDINDQMGLGLRYNYGFDFDESGDLSRFTNEFKIRNSVFRLNFEYRFN